MLKYYLMNKDEVQKKYEEFYPWWEANWEKLYPFGTKAKLIMILGEMQVTESQAFTRYGKVYETRKLE